MPELVGDIEDLVGLDTQAERCHEHTKGYVKTTASGISARLECEKGYEKKAFSLKTIHNVLNRLGYTLKKVIKCLPLKRIKETDAIFENVKVHRKATEEGILRISIDVKDKVHIGELSREGYHRQKDSVKALDKDQQWDETLVPFGILNLNTNQSTIVVGNSAETSDFIVESLNLWFEENKAYVQQFHTLEIYSDNGPQVKSNRTQFINRIMEFACNTGLKVHLLYYPPYHSKYNPIERVWAAVEQYWNPTILSTVEYALNTLRNVKWKSKNLVVIPNFKTYEKGVKLTPNEMKKREEFLIRKQEIRYWDVFICPSPEMGRLFIT